jgi:BirA family biotin operon repressor/biotin-[acetyl-CoA-carboxylase] ligase
MIIGSQVIFFDELTSTNSEASSIIIAGEVPEGTVIRAGFQSAGRGHGTNKWESQKRMNLLFSIILHPQVVTPSDQFYISMAVSLGIADFVARYCRGTKIKWPNDIYVNDDKIAGILIENSITGDTILNSVAGIGININQTAFDPLVPNPVSLKISSGQNFDLDKCFDELLAVIDLRYKELLYGNRDELKSRYLSLLYRANEWHDYISEAKRFSGRVTGISPAGKLIIEQKGGKISEFGFKEVEFSTERITSR